MLILIFIAIAVRLNQESNIFILQRINQGKLIPELTPAELKAVLVHKYLASCEKGREVPLEEAIPDFLGISGSNWGYWAFCQAQKDEIERIISEVKEKNPLVSRNYIANEFAKTKAEQFNKRWKMLEGHEFLETKLMSENGIHERLSGLANTLWCCIFVSAPDQNNLFMLNGRLYADARTLKHIPEKNEVHVVTYGRDKEIAIKELAPVCAK